MTSHVAVESHPFLRVDAFTTTFPGQLGEIGAPAWLTALLSGDAETSVHCSDSLRAAVRAMLRHGGYKPTGRGKPASEYLLRTAREGGIRSINVAVDACNIVSLHSGLPISVVDLDRATPPYRIALASEGSRYVFNPSGQEIDASGLICLFDAMGPCGSPAKDAQRTKTNDSTRRTLSVVWGCSQWGPQLTQATDWYWTLLARLGAHCAAVTGAVEYSGSDHVDRSEGV
jgi:DNA/RNA-binding domain of Phe-tRNA-synthetase-like protein